VQGCGLRDRAPDFLEKKAVIVGVSFDSVEENRAFAEKFAFPYPLLCDTSRAIGLAYGATEPGETGNARRVAYLIGPDGRVQLVVPKADTKAFASQMLAAIDAA